MLQYASSSPQQAFAEQPQHGGFEHYFAIAKRRLLYLFVPFVVILVLGSLVVAIQRPLYQAAGKVLVETQDIPADLVRPTITDTANQRIQVIQQRIMTRDNLLEIVKKFGLFPSQQRWMSSSQLLDLMRERTKLKLGDLDLPNQQNNLTITFTLTFDYEHAEIATQVANELLTLVLNEDARNRTNRAAETTKFLEQETKRLQGVVASMEAKTTEVTLKALDPDNPDNDASSQIRQRREELAKEKLELVRKSSLYSAGHPEVKALKKRIAALETIVSQEPEKSPEKSQVSPQGLDVLKLQLTSAEANLDEANRKLLAARLGETLERNQQSERLQVLEQPVVPQKPIKPNRPKLLALVFVLALFVGVGAAMTAESMDKSIHSTQELTGVIDSSLIVAIPLLRHRRRDFAEEAE